METVTGRAKGPRARKVVPHRCTECGKPFRGIAIKHYDSRACQVRAYRHRKKTNDTREVKQ